MGILMAWLWPRLMANSGSCGSRWFRNPDKHALYRRRAAGPGGRAYAAMGGAGLTSGTIIGSTRYHDIVAAIDRVEIGSTWYAKRWQRRHVNTTCKLLLLGHAFDTLGCKVVGLRTDKFNFRSQRAIEALGAKKDGVIRHHRPRRDGTVRDTVIYSILATEWPDVKRHLELRLARHGRPSIAVSACRPTSACTRLPHAWLAVQSSLRASAAAEAQRSTV